MPAHPPPPSHVGKLDNEIPRDMNRLDLETGGAGYTVHTMYTILNHIIAHITEVSTYPFAAVCLVLPQRDSVRERPCRKNVMDREMALLDLAVQLGMGGGG